MVEHRLERVGGSSALGSGTPGPVQGRPRLPGGDLVKSADRTLAILELLSASGSLRFIDIADKLELPRSSVHGVLATLVSRGFVDHHPPTRGYSLGLKVWTIGQAYQGHRDLVSLALPLMEALAQSTGETVQMARLDGIENVYIAIAESPQPMKLVSAVGKRLPAYATGLGKALLSGLDQDELKRRFYAVSLERFTPHTVTGLAELLNEVHRVAVNGYATDNEEYIVGCRCAAVPIHSVSGEIIAAMSVSAPTPRCGIGWLEETKAKLDAVVAELRRELSKTSSPAPA